MVHVRYRYDISKEVVKLTVTSSRVVDMVREVERMEEGILIEVEMPEAAHRT